MTVAVKYFTRKTGDVQLVKFDASTTESMEDVRNWVVDNVPVDTEVTLRTSMGGLLFWPGVNVRPGEYIAKGSNGKLFKLTQDLVDAFFDEV